MKKQWIIVTLWFLTTQIQALPSGFVYLKDIAPSIRQEMRYYGPHNFVGRRIQGYQAPRCILTRPAALALARVQQQLLKQNLSLKVYDCYRPQRAVNDFIRWSRHDNETATQAEFFPGLKKHELFAKGFVAKRSGHSRGSTVDLTLVPVPTPASAPYTPGQPLVACFAPKAKRFADNSIEMGTGFDCFDRRSHPFNPKIPARARHNRHILRQTMFKQHFRPLSTEWWHFTLRREPYPRRYFDFVVK